MKELDKKETKEFPMLWWNFNKYVRFPSGILLSLGNITYYSQMTFNTTISLLFGIDVACICLLCTTYYHFLKKNKIGYKLLNTLLIVELLINAFSSTMRSGSFVTTDFIINVSILGLIWTLPNYMYFRKRKLLFCNSCTKLGNKKEVNNSSISEESQNITEGKIEFLGSIDNSKEHEKIEQNNHMDLQGPLEGWKTATITLSIITTIVTLALVFFVLDNNELKKQKEELNSAIAEQKESNKELLDDYYENISEKLKIKQKADFFDTYAVIVPSNTQVYHKYDCEYCDRSSFSIFNISSAEARGFIPCSHCIE